MEKHLPTSLSIELTVVSSFFVFHQDSEVDSLEEVAEEVGNLSFLCLPVVIVFL